MSDQPKSASQATFTAIGRMTARPGQRDGVIARLVEQFRRIDPAAGLLSATLSEPLDDPDAVWVTQLWVDKESHDTVMRSPEMRAATQELMALLAEPPSGSHCRVVFAH